MINKFLPLVGITVILALLIVWERTQTTKCGYTVVKLQERIMDLQKINRRLCSEISVLRKPERIVRVVQAINPNLTQSLENRPTTAKTKQQLIAREKNEPTKTIIFASARAKTHTQQASNRQGKGRKKCKKR